MTLQEWEGLSPEEQQAMMEENAAEMERCKGQRYFYNNYCRKEGEPEYSQEQWDYYMKREEARRIGGRQWAKYMNGMIPLTPNECVK